MVEENDALPAGVITTAQAAKLLIVSEAWLGRLAKEGYIQKLDRGRWNLVSVVQGHNCFADRLDQVVQLFRICPPTPWKWQARSRWLVCRLKANAPLTERPDASW